MSSFDHPIAEPPREPPALDHWLREHLGRQLIIAALVASSPDSAALDDFRAPLSAYAEVRLVESAADPAATDRQLEQLLAPLAQLDPDIVLVWATSLDHISMPASWSNAALAACEHLGLLDRCYVALIAPQMTRSDARALGFEEGFPTTQPVTDLLAVLAREAVARDDYRRRGSSPPCFL